MTFPTAEDDSDPLKGEGPNGRLMRFAAGPLLPVIHLGPTAVRDGLPSIFMERLPEERWTTPAHVGEHGAAAALHLEPLSGVVGPTRRYHS